MTTAPFLLDLIFINRFREARPAAVGVKLVQTAEQWLPADDVNVYALLLVVPELVPERRLGATLLRDMVLDPSELLFQLFFARFTHK